MKGELSEADFRTLRAYRDAAAPIPIKSHQGMFDRLFARRLVIGAVGYDAKGDPIGVVRLTPAARHALDFWLTA